MSEIYNDITGEDKTAHQTCRVAYTINNLQPVVCTIIGEEPLFYMDFDTAHEDEDMLFDAADLNVLKGELDILNHELQNFDTFAKEILPDSEKKIALFLDDVKSITQPAIKGGTRNEDLKALKDLLGKSRLAGAYLNHAKEYGIDLVLSDQIETAFYDRDNGHIFINASLNRLDQMFLAIRELRRHWQHRQGALIHPLTFHPDNAVLVHRAQTADLIVSIIRVAWELQLSGDKEAWEKIENSSMADMGRAFAREAFLDFRTINNGQAMAAVFESWFLSERALAQDKILINQMLADHQGYVFDLQQSETVVTPSLIAALGEMPFGKNYLAEHAATIMDDAIFTDIRDRSNANFLWFIKFERTFRETEQELQNSEGLNTEGVLSSATQSEKQDYINGALQPRTAEIISLWPESNTESNAGNATNETTDTSEKRLSSGDAKARRDNKNNVSNIVYLRCWSGE